MFYFLIASILLLDYSVEARCPCQMTFCSSLARAGTWSRHPLSSFLVDVPSCNMVPRPTVLPLLLASSLLPNGQHASTATLDGT